MNESLGDAAQTRMIAEQVAEAVIVKYAATHPEAQEANIPSPLKWAGMMAAAAQTAAAQTGVGCAGLYYAGSGAVFSAFSAGPPA